MVQNYLFLIDSFYDKKYLNCIEFSRLAESYLVHTYLDRKKKREKKITWIFLFLIKKIGLFVLDMFYGVS